MHDQDRKPEQHAEGARYETGDDELCVAFTLLPAISNVFGLNVAALSLLLKSRENAREPWDLWQIFIFRRLRKQSMKTVSPSTSHLKKVSNKLKTSPNLEIRRLFDFVRDFWDTLGFETFANFGPGGWPGDSCNCSLRSQHLRNRERALNKRLWAPLSRLLVWLLSFLLCYQAVGKGGLSLRGGSLHDGFGSFDGFSGSGKHFSLLSLVLRDEGQRGKHDGFDGFGGFGGCGGFGRDGYAP